MMTAGVCYIQTRIPTVLGPSSFVDVCCLLFVAAFFVGGKAGACSFGFFRPLALSSFWLFAFCAFSNQKKGSNRNLPRSSECLRGDPEKVRKPQLQYLQYALLYALPILQSAMLLGVYLVVFTTCTRARTCPQSADVEANCTAL